MGIDAVALLRIRKLTAPPGAHAAEFFVEHRGKASLLHTFNRFSAATADEHALLLRRLLGPTLDAHDDPRGILLFPDVCEPKGRSYDAIVREVEAAGVWAPKVELGHVPERYTAAPADSHEALVAQMIEKLGRDVATQLDMLAQVHALIAEASGGSSGAARDYRAAVAAIAEAMGSEFTERYQAKLRQKVDAERAAQAAHFGGAQALLSNALAPSKKTKR